MAKLPNKPAAASGPAPTDADKLREELESTKAQLAEREKALADKDKSLQDQLAEAQAAREAAEKAAAEAQQRLVSLTAANTGEAQPPVAPGVNPALQNPSQTDRPKSLDDLMREIAAQGGPKSPIMTEAPTADDHNKEAEVIQAKPTKKQMLEELARMYGTSTAEVEKMLEVDGGFKVRPGVDPIPPIDLPLPEGTTLVPVKVTHDYWAGKQIVDQWPGQPDERGEGGDNRIVAGTVIKLPGVEARRLINEGKAVRADPMPDEA